MMIFESVQFSNEFTISDLQAKIDSGYFDEFLNDFSIFVMTEKGIVKINKDNKQIEYNSIVDLNNYVSKIEGKGLSTNDYTNEEKNLVASISDKANVGESYTKSESDIKYVEKENNKRLITEEEITKLNSLNNYDDSNVNNEITKINTTLQELSDKHDMLPILLFDDNGNLNVTINGVTKIFTPNT